MSYLCVCLMSVNKEWILTIGRISKGQLGTQVFALCLG